MQLWGIIECCGGAFCCASDLPTNIEDVFAALAIGELSPEIYVLRREFALTAWAM